MIAAPLYLICLTIELIHVLPRFTLAFFVAAGLGCDEDTAALIALVVAFFPLIWSVGTLLGIPGGWGMKREFGARRPSHREKTIVKPVLDELRRRGMRRRVVWFVNDNPTPNAQAIGSTIYINSGLIDHSSLAAVLAHECGHIARSSARVLLALIRLELPGVRVLRVYLALIENRVLATLVRVFSGGGTWQLPVISSLWRVYFRRSEHRADRWARRQGYGYELAAYLDTYDRPIDIASPFGVGRTHPYAEQRIDRLTSSGTPKLRDRITR